MNKLLLALWVLGEAICPSARGNAYRKLLLDPPKLEKIVSGSCHVMTLSLVNADGEGSIAEREKVVDLSSSFPTTVFYSYFDPPCTEGMKTKTVSFVPGKSVVKFFFRDTLTQTPDATVKGTPHTITITASSRGVVTATAEADIRSDDCAIGCRDTCINNRAACTKKCPPPKDPGTASADKRKCWSDCFEGEEKCFGHCQKFDLRYVEGGCLSSCQTFCEYFYGDCYGKCYFHQEARNTASGAKCVDSCVRTRDKCRGGGCSSSNQAVESEEFFR